MSTHLENIKAEAALLGSVIKNEELLDDLDIEAIDFSRYIHRKIFDAIQNIKSRNKPVDIVSVSERLSEVGCFDDIGGSQALSDVLSMASSDERKIQNYAKIVRGLSLKRQVRATLVDTIDSIDNARELSAGDIIEAVQANIFDIGTSRGGSYVEIAPVVKIVENQIEDAIANTGNVTGVTTGFDKLDRITGGFQKQNLIIIAARPAMGKSCMALNLLDNAAMEGVPVGFFSLEMSKEQLVLRLISRRTGVPIQRILGGMISPDEAISIADATQNIARLPILIDERVGLTELDILSSARRMVRSHGVRLICIDYIQRVECSKPTGNEAKDIGTIVKCTKNIARHLDIPVIILSQLNRSLESSGDPRPKMSSMKSSGDLEQEADLIMTLFRPEYYDKNPELAGVAEVDICKFRQGRTGVIRMCFDGVRQEFKDVLNEAW